MPSYIYILCDPREDDPVKRARYVGCTFTPATRLDRHMARTAAGGPRLRAWIADLRGARLRPQMEIVEAARFGLGRDREDAWIHYLRRRGCDLTNAPAIRGPGRRPDRRFADLFEARRVVDERWRDGRWHRAHTQMRRPRVEGDRWTGTS